jgi:ATP-dependent DNA ligase
LKALAAEKKEGEEKKSERPMQQDCVIVGYVPSGSAEIGFTGLIVATTVGEEKELHYVATVSEGITPAQRAELLPKLRSLERQDPLVPCNVPGAMWVDPSLTCRIRFAEWTKDWFFKDPALDVMLQKIETP